MAPRANEVGERLLKAIAHPLRHQVLVAIEEAGEASPLDVASALGQPLGRVSHHVRVLADLGAIELVRTEPRRGATAHYYRARVVPWYDDETWARLPRVTRRAIFGSTLDQLVSHISRAAGSDGFDHPRAHVSFTALELDDQGMDEAASLLSQVLERLQAVRLESAERLAGDPAPLRTEVGIVHFTRE